MFLAEDKFCLLFHLIKRLLYNSCFECVLIKNPCSQIIPFYVFSCIRSIDCLSIILPYNRTRNKCFWLQISWKFCLLWLDSKFLGLFETNHLNVVYIQFVYNNFRKFLFTNANTQVVEIAVQGHIIEFTLPLCSRTISCPIKFFQVLCTLV